MKQKLSDGALSAAAIEEDGFSLPLTTLVQGTDVSGNAFQERTVLSCISHQGSSFELKTRVSKGSELLLSCSLPSNLCEDKSLRLLIKGTVIDVESRNASASVCRVSLKFGNKYIITE